jgi:hypothetical protein
MTVRSASRPLSYLSRLSTLDSIRTELDEMQGSLPWSIRRFSANDQVGLVPTGVRKCLLIGRSLRDTGSFQLTLLGIQVILHRTELDLLNRSCSALIFSTVLQTAFDAAHKVVMFVLGLTTNDRAMFWMPCELRYQERHSPLQTPSTTCPTQLRFYCASRLNPESRILRCPTRLLTPPNCTARL